MLNIELPGDMKGFALGNAVYAIGKDTYRFAANEAKEMVEWNSFDSIQISVAVEYELINPPSGLSGPQKGSGKFGFSARWRASFTDSGLELEPDGKQPKALGTTKGDGLIAVTVAADASQSKASDKKPFVELTFVPVIGYEEDGIQIGFGGAGVSAAKTIGRNKSSVSTQLTYRINLNVNRPVAERPIAKIPSDLLAPDPFYIDGDELAKDSKSKFNGWINKVKDHDNGYLRTVIQLGEAPIGLEAYSSTGNKKETDKMIDIVQKAFKKGLGGSKFDFKEKSSKAKDQRVEIIIDGNKATKAIEEFVRGKQPDASAR